MASAVALRDDFTAAEVRGLAPSSGDANQVRRLLALATIYEGETCRETALVSRGFTIGFCGSTRLDLTGRSTRRHPAEWLAG